jgi:hypothetical protein
MYVYVMLGGVVDMVFVEVHSHAELAHLFLADNRRIRQLYFDNRRQAAAKSLEEATNVTTVVQTMLHKNFVIHTCNDVIAEFIESDNYDVFKKRDTDDENVLALVVRKKSGPQPFRPFKFSHVRFIMKVNDRIICSCCATTVHGRPCRHILAYNEGKLDPSDFAHIHTKTYAASLETSVFKYDGVVQHRAHSELPEVVEQSEDEVEDQSAIADGDDGTADFGFAKPQKEKKCHGFRSLQKEFKRFTDKWGNTPRALKSLCQIIADHDSELGDVADYRCGRGTSKPTYQASRSKKH